MSDDTKRVTIKLDPTDHKKLKMQSAKEGLFLNEKVENLIEDYVFDAVKLKSENFKMKQKKIRLVIEIYDKIKDRIEKDSCEKRRNLSKTKVAKALIDKYILNEGESYFDFKVMERKMIAFYQDRNNQSDLDKNKVLSFNVNEKMSKKINSKINNNRASKKIDKFQRKMEVLFYAYAKKEINLEDSYFEKRHLSIRLDNDLYKKFKDSLMRYGSKLTIQKVGESLIKRELKES